MINPYTVGNPVLKTDFYGRKELIENLLDEHRQLIYLMGTRRSGKTSLLHQLEAQSPGIGIYLDLQFTDADSLKMGQVLIQTLKNKAHKRSVLRDLPWGPSREFCESLQILDEIAETRNLKFLILIDEAEKLLEFEDAYLNHLRGALHGCHNIRVIFSATRRLLKLNTLQRNWNTTPFLFGIEIEYLSPLMEAEAVDLICQTSHRDGCVTVDPHLINPIMDWSGRSPYLIQFLCKRLFQTNRSLRPLRETDLVLEENLQALFQNDCSTLLPEECALLHELAHRGETTELELNRNLGLKSEQLYTCIDILKRLGYVNGKEDKYLIASRFLKTWLLLNPLCQDSPAIPIPDEKPLTPREIRPFLEKLDEVEIKSLCLDYYPEVYDKLGSGLQRSEIINLLLDYCRKSPERMKQLWNLLREKPVFSQTLGQ